MRNLGYNQKEDKFLISRIMDGHSRFLRTGKSFSSPFLDEGKFLLVTNYLKGQKIDYSVYQAHDLSNKKVIYFGEYEDFVTSFRTLNIDGSIRHKDVLGSLFGLGLSEDMIGDIFVESDFIYFSVLTKVVPVVLQELHTISRYTTTLEEHSISLKENHEKVFSISVSSNRIDSILSRIIPCSRSMSVTYLKEGKVSLFYQEVDNSSLLLEEGDILSIRGVGKYRIGKILGRSKSGKMILEVIKYQ